MKRNRYGINFDLGVPLQSKEDFEILYIELNPDQKQRFVDWINDENQDAIIVAGQIGTGKTTFIEKAFQEASSQCDIRIGFDTEVTTYVRGAFWGFFLGKIIEFAQKQKCNLAEFRLSEDLIKINYDDNGLDQLVKALCDRPISISDFNEKKKLYHSIDENIEFISRQLGDIIEQIENKINRPLFVFAEGIDKFSHYTTEYVSLVDLLNFLKKYKTLYEANLFHLIFHLIVPKQKWNDSSKILLTGVSDEKIIEVLKKRLGVYSPSRENMLPLLSRLSGGNLRQALRLLVEYDYALGKMRKDTKEALDHACQRVRDDLLNIPVGGIEPELLKVVKRDQYITSGTLDDFGSREGSQNAIYQNQIIIMGEANKELKWPAIVNPLLLPAVEALKDLPESPETKLLREWAEAHEISPFGLEIDVTAIDKNQKFFDIISSSQQSFASLHITEIFESMAAYFLNPERKDKIIIAYENRELVQVANDFIVGKAGTFTTGRFKQVTISKKMKINAVETILKELKRPGETDVYDGFSFFFARKLTKEELIVMDQKRDEWLEHKMIWWIPYDDLKGYIKYWTQLRQLTRIYLLEEDVLGNITKDDIQQDLARLKHIHFPEEHKINTKEKLEAVLKILEKKSNG
ncbi:MAG: hypothetical protein JSV88_19370 [Candidatus Aminicenantes bacterium]|nr:MAG: hypothetical protein JSV88_19370 [Candidatus Aminicenantes bacterium]